MDIAKLHRDDRMRLLKFVIAFAWADLEVQEGERSLVRKLANLLEISAEDALLVDTWLAIPPRAEEVDPNDIPQAHKKLFLDAARQMVHADGKVSEDEAENLALFEQMLG